MADRLSVSRGRWLDIQSFWTWTLLALAVLGSACSRVEADWELRSEFITDHDGNGPFATAVGGSQGFSVRGPDGQPVEGLSVALLDDTFSLADAPINADFELIAQKAGRGRVRVHNGEEEKLFSLEAREAVDVEVIPYVVTVDLVTERLFEHADIEGQWQAFADGAFLRTRLTDSDGEFLVDERLELSLEKLFVAPNWDLRIDRIPEREILIEAVGYEGLTQRAKGVTSIDRIELLAGPSEITVGIDAYYCFRAFKDGEPVWSVPWDIALIGPMERRDQGFELVLGDHDCTSLEAIEAGAGTLLVRAGGAELAVEITATQAP